VDYAFANPQTVDFLTNVPGSTGPTFSLRNFDATNPANYVYRGFYEENQVAKGDDWQARLDAEFRTGIEVLPKLQFGVRYVDRYAERQFGNRYSTQNGGAALSAVPLTYVLSAAGFGGDSMAPSPSRWLAPTYSSIQSNLGQLRTFAGYPAGEPPFDPTQAVTAKETSKAAYAQASFQFGIVDGQVGIRVVQTRDKLAGNQLYFGPDPDGAGPLQPPPGVVRAVQLDRKYTDWLPNLNLNAHLTSKLQARLAVTRTRTRPSFRDLSPSETIDRPGTCFDTTPIPQGCTLTGGGGNPYLERLKSTNYDASLEYYFSRTGFMAIAAYRRDLKGFVQTNITDVIEPISGRPLRLNAPTNSGKGRIQGFEAQVQTFFDWAFVPDWARRFGVQANATYIDSNATFTFNNEYQVNVVNKGLLGVSKWSTNLVGMYEGGGLSIRLAYNTRSPYWTVYQRRDSGSAASLNLYQERVRTVSRLDLSSSYDVTHNFTLFFDWTNMLHKPFRSDLYRTQVATSETVVFPRAVRYEESILTGGVRFRF
jgi:TonB-dependent receptor